MQELNRKRTTLGQKLTHGDAGIVDWKDVVLFCLLEEESAHLLQLARVDVGLVLHLCEIKGQGASQVEQRSSGAGSNRRIFGSPFSMIDNY